MVRISYVNLVAFVITVLPLVGVAGENAMRVRVVPAITDEHILYDEAPVTGEHTQSISVVVAQDEYEPASFVVYADQMFEGLVVEAGKFATANGDVLPAGAVDIRVVKRWFQRGFGDGRDPFDRRNWALTSELLVYDDKLVIVKDGENFVKLTTGEYVNISKPGKLRKFLTPGVDQFPVRDADSLQPLDIAAGSNRQFWLTVYIPPDTKSGVYTGWVSLRDSNGVVADVPMTIEVLPFTLSSSMVDHGIYYRGILDKNRMDGSVSSEYKSRGQMLADMRNLKAHGVSNPTVYQKYLGGLLPDVLELRRQAGLETRRLIYTGVNMYGDYTKGPEVLAANVRGVKKIADSYGYEEVYFYARDEGREELLLEQLPMWSTVKAAGGKVVAAGWRADDKSPGNFAVTDGAEDIYVCNGTLNHTEVTLWHSKDKLIYSYMNPAAGRHLPETLRRNYGLLLWQFDYDGALPYAWQHSFADAWNDFDHYRHKDTNLTYPTINKPIDTLQWEGFREGIDDLRYLATLIAELEKDGNRGRLAANQARDWIEQLRTSTLAKSDLQSVRAQMIGYILALRGWADENDAANQIVNAYMEPLENNNRAVINWSTTVRSDTKLQSLTGSGQSPVLSNDGQVFSHRVAGPVVAPRSTNRFGLSSTDGIGVAQEEILVTADPGISLAGRVSEFNDGNYVIGASLFSDYRSSVFVDWQNSLLGWWRFSSADSFARDLSPAGNDVSLKGGARLGSGWYGNGVALDGKGSFANIPDIEIAENGTATIEGWFRFNSFPMDTLSRMGIFSGLYQHPRNNHFYFTRTNDSFDVASHLSLGEWHHIALTWDGETITALLYIDGRVIKPTVRGAINKIGAIDGLNIGRSAGFFGKLVQRSSGNFDGDFDEVRVWNRVLSHNEILASYNANTAKLRFVYDTVETGKPDWAITAVNAADEVFTP